MRQFVSRVGHWLLDQEVGATALLAMVGKTVQANGRLDSKVLQILLAVNPEPISPVGWCQALRDRREGGMLMGQLAWRANPVDGYLVTSNPVEEPTDRELWLVALDERASIKKRRLSATESDIEGGQRMAKDPVGRGCRQFCAIWVVALPLRESTRANTLRLV